MTDAADRLTRCLRIAGRIALSSGALTAARIAQVEGIPKRTVYRDIDALRGMGVPVRGEAGQGYQLPKPALQRWVDQVVWRERCGQ